MFKRIKKKKEELFRFQTELRRNIKEPGLSGFEKKFLNPSFSN